MSKNFFGDQQFLPQKYRETSYDFGLGKDVYVAGLARLDYGGQNIEETLMYLKKRDINTIFGLDASSKFIIIAHKLGLNYVDVTIKDFSAPDISLYDFIYKQIIEEEANGKKVAIHCFGGIGRTGTILAALKLKEFAQLECFYEEEPLKNTIIDLPYSQGPISCTLNVRNAIIAVREVPGSEKAVEAEVQVQSLCQYEQQLRIDRTTTLSLQSPEHRQINF